MRICIDKNGKLLEMQSHATEGTLITNAVNAGHFIGDIEEKVVTDEEFASIFRTPDVIAAEGVVIQRHADIIDALPSWQEVADAIDGVTTVAGLRTVVRKLARVVYWLAKNKGV